MSVPIVSVELAQRRGKTYASALFRFPDGELLTVDHCFVRPGIYGNRPKVELPNRPEGAMWLPVIHLPQPWYSALVDAVAQALAS